MCHFFWWSGKGYIRRLANGCSCCSKYLVCAEPSAGLVWAWPIAVFVFKFLFWVNSCFRLKSLVRAHSCFYFRKSVVWAISCCVLENFWSEWKAVFDSQKVRSKATAVFVSKVLSEPIAVFCYRKGLIWANSCFYFREGLVWANSCFCYRKGLTWANSCFCYRKGLILANSCFYVRKFLVCANSCFCYRKGLIWVICLPITGRRTLPLSAGRQFKQVKNDYL